MNRTTHSITLVLVSSALVLHGCADNNNQQPAATQSSRSSAHAGPYYFGHVSGGSPSNHNSQSADSSVHNGSTRGGFGSHATYGGS